MAEQELVAILMGSDSDWEKIRPASDTLKQFGVPHEVRVLSAHRTPQAAAHYAETAGRRGLKVLVCAAGGAAHLAGIVAAHTVLPVIGIPVAGGALNGMDALLSTVQMPSGIPVASVAVGSAGPVNAALFAIQILALSRPDLNDALEQYRKSLACRVADGNERVQKTLCEDSDAPV